MEKFAKMLTDKGVPYIWVVFTTDRFPTRNPNMVYLPPQLNIAGYIQKADYLVQLSDAEAYNFSAVEAEKLGVPCILTDLPVYKELGIKNGKNAWILDMDLKKVPIDKIVEGLPEFTYEPPEDAWDKELAKGKSNYEKDKLKRFKVEATSKYMYGGISDRGLSVEKKIKDYIPQEGETWEVDYLRKEKLKDMGFVKEIEEIKPKKVKEKKK